MTLHLPRSRPFKDRSICFKFKKICIESRSHFSHFGLTFHTLKMQFRRRNWRLFKHFRTLKCKIRTFQMTFVVVNLTPFWHFLHLFHQICTKLKWQLLDIFRTFVIKFTPIKWRFDCKSDTFWMPFAPLFQIRTLQMMFLGVNLTPFLRLSHTPYHQIHSYEMTFH